MAPVQKIQSPSDGKRGVYTTALQVCRDWGFLGISLFVIGAKHVTKVIVEETHNTILTEDEEQHLGQIISLLKPSNLTLEKRMTVVGAMFPSYETFNNVIEACKTSHDVYYALAMIQEYLFLSVDPTQTHLLLNRAMIEARLAEIQLHYCQPTLEELGLSWRDML